MTSKTGNAWSLPAPEAEIREMLAKSFANTLNGSVTSREDSARISAGMATLSFLHKELTRIGRVDVYDDEYRRHQWRVLGYDPGAPEADEGDATPAP